MKILLVDESAAVARLARTLLEEAGAKDARITHVPRLSAALKRIRREPFDAVLLDLTLPDARGLEALRRVQESLDELPVVVFNGLGDDLILDDENLSRADATQLRAQGMLLRRAIEHAIERKQAEHEARHLAFHDPLTGLPNRQLLFDRLGQAIERGRRDRHLFAVFFLDLDGFKEINDTLGHSNGDLVLKAISSRLTGHLRKSDTLARFGGDEFVFILPDLAHISDAERIASKIEAALEAPVSIAGREVRITSSIGVSTFPADGETAELLLKRADAAMYRAKRRSGVAAHART